MNKKLQKGIGAAMAAAMGTGIAAPVFAAQAATTDLAAKYEAAYNATAKATASNLQTDLTAARVLVDALYAQVKGTADEYLATTLSQKLDQAQQVKLNELFTAMDKAGKSLSQADINTARDLLLPMPDQWVRSFSSALDKTQQKLVEKVVAAVVKAQASGSQEDALTAIALYNDVLSVRNNDGVKAWADAYKAEVNKLEVSVSAKVSAITTKVDGTIPGYNDTVLNNKKALLQARVADKDGKGVAGVTVVFSEVDKVGTTQLEGLTVATTNADGVAVAVASIYTTNNGVGSLKYKATVVGKDLSVEGVVRFAAISLGNVTNVNSHNIATDVNGDDDLVPSDNATSAYEMPVVTRNMNLNSVEYVASQQVSKTGGAEHAVTFSAKPLLQLPTAFGETKTDTYRQDINEASGEYHPYATWTKKYTVPAGLKYATLNIAKLQTAPYSKFKVDLYDASGNFIQNVYTVDGKNDTTNFGVQIPVQVGAATVVKVTLQAPGQVQTDLNDGVVVSSITGVYSNRTTNVGSTVELPGATIKWEATDVTYSNPTVLSNAANYITNGYEKDYTYSYQVPVFPYTGNAVIVGKNANGEVKQYFVFPTVNNGVNQNVLASTADYQAILTTEKEAKTAVGSVTQNGNVVTANSTAVGYTALKGTVSIPGFGSDLLDATNNTLYTSVQWAPVQTAETGTAVAAHKKVYALVGQNVEVTAQVVDANGNPVSKNGLELNWTLPTDMDNATTVQKDNITDVNGQAKLVLTDGVVAKLAGVTAKAPTGYKVVLKLGQDTVETADIYWVNAGLTYQSELSKPVVGPVLGDVKTVDVSNVNVGKTVEYGYKLSGIDKDGNTVVISGIPVAFSTNSGVGTMTPGSGATFTATSNTAGLLSVQGDMGAPSGNVVFTVYETDGDLVGTFNGAGTGATSMLSTLILPVQFGSVGQQVSFVNPFGTNVAATSTKVYAKLTDSLGNPIAGSAEVTVDGVKNTVTADNNGVIEINVAKGTAATSVVTVKYTDKTISETINWITPTLVNFEAVNAGLNASGTNDVIAVKFTQTVNAASVNANEFTLTSNGTAYAIKDARVVGNIVYLTLADSNAHLPQTTKATYTVTMNSAKAANGVTYSVADNYGRAVTAGATISFAVPSASTIEATIDKANLKLTVSPKEANVAATSGTVTLVSSDLDAIANETDGTKTITLGTDSTTVDLTAAVVGTTFDVYYNGQQYTLTVR